MTLVDSEPPPSTLRAMQGLELAPQYFHFLYSNCMLGIFSVTVRPALIPSDKKLTAAFRRVVETTPILQTQIVGELPHPTFERLENPQLWPKIHIHHVESDEDEQEGVIATANKMAQGELEMFRKGGSSVMRKVPIIFHAVIGPSRVAGAFVAPHCFMDGMGAGTCVLKGALYGGLPKVFWPIIDHFSSEEVPSYYEMMLKKDIGVLDRIDNLHAMSTSRPGLDPNNFRFEHYNVEAPGAEKMLNGLSGEIANVPSAAMKRCGAQLRKADVTLSSAFGALVIKALAIILRKRNLNPHDKPLISFFPGDGRKYGKWGNKRRDKKLRFPVVGCYSFFFETQIPMKDAFEGSIESISSKIKSNFHHYLSDPKIHAQNVSKIGLNSSGMLVGCSSVVFPNPLPNPISSGVFGAKPESLEIEHKQDYPPTPRVWLYILTVGKMKTVIKAEIALPIEGLDKKEVQSAIKDAAAGSPLEMLFTSMS